MSSENFEPALSTYQHEFWDGDERNDVESERSSSWLSKKKSVLMVLTLVVVVAVGGAMMSTRLGRQDVSKKTAVKAAKPKVQKEYAGPNCPDGEYLASAACHICPKGSKCSGNQKNLCPAGEYQPDAGKAACIPATCGHYVSAPGATMQLVCRAGTYSDPGATSCTATPVGTFTGAGACKPGECPAGKFQDCAGQPDCQDPPCGHFVAAPGSNSYTPCPAGTFQPLIGQTGCDPVGQGEYSGPGHCKPRKCIPGYFQDQSGKPACKPADCGKKVPTTGSNNQVACAKGQYQPEPGQPVCIDIPAGYISDQNGCAIKCCPKGQFRNSNFECQDAPCGSFVPNECASVATKCAAGYFTTGPGASVCTIAPPGYIPNADKCGKKPCEVGTYQNLAGQTTCKNSPCGFIAPNTGMANPAACPPGKYQDLTKQTTCKDCAAGTANPSSGQCSCPDCAAGTFQTNAGQQTCDDSPCGHYVPAAGATKALPCPAGTYQPATKQTSCINAAPGEFTVGGKCAVDICEPGRYTPDPKMTKCLDAPCGSFVAGPKAASAVKCSPGEYQPLTAQTKCLPAPTGSYTNADGSCTETPCTPGNYQDQTGQQNCKPADCGHYVVITGASSQSKCGKGRFQKNTGQTKCDFAQPGSFVDTETACDQTPCVQGEYTDCQGQSACIKAPCGYFVDTSGATVVKQCPDGMYQDVPGQGSCKITPAGSFSKMGFCHAQQCDPGTFQNLAQQSTCKQASCGNFVEIEGAQSQSQCAAGTYQPDVGQVGCLPTTMALAPNPGTCTKVTPGGGVKKCTAVDGVNYAGFNSEFAAVKSNIATFGGGLCMFITDFGSSCSGWTQNGHFYGYHDLSAYSSAYISFNHGMLTNGARDYKLTVSYDCVGTQASPGTWMPLIVAQYPTCEISNSWEYLNWQAQLPATCVGKSSVGIRFDFVGTRWTSVKNICLSPTALLSNVNGCQKQQAPNPNVVVAEDNVFASVNHCSTSTSLKLILKEGSSPSNVNSGYTVVNGVGLAVLQSTKNLYPASGAAAPSLTVYAKFSIASDMDLNKWISVAVKEKSGAEQTWGLWVYVTNAARTNAQVKFESGSASAQATITVSPNVAMTLVGTYDAGATALKLYVNGVSSGQAQMSSAMTVYSEAISLGNAPGSSDFKGHIMEFEYSEPAMSAAEVSQLNSAGVSCP